MLVRLLVISLMATAALAAPSKKTDTAAEIAALKEQLEALAKYVEKLEAKIEAKAEIPARTEAASHGAPAEPDPLAAMERDLGYRKSPESGVRSPEPEPVNSEAPPAADPLAAVEAALAATKAAPTGNPRTAFNPQISVVGDFVYRNSSIDEDPALPDVNGVALGDAGRDRFSFRELEVAFQASIDPFSRADVYLAFPGILEEIEDDIVEANEPKVEVEEAFITYWRLPYGLQLKAGKFRLEIGKNNKVHDHDMEFVDRPLPVLNFLGGEGIAEQGLGLQKFFKIGSVDTQLELTGQLLDGEGGEETLFAGPSSDKTMALGRARLYHDFDQSTNIDVGHTQLVGRHDAVGALSQRIRQYDLTFRYEPVSQNVYKRFPFRIEHFHGDRDVPQDFDGDGIIDFIAHQKPDGTYVLAEYQWDRFWIVGARHDNTNPAFMMAEQAVDPTLTQAERDRAVAGFDRIDSNTVFLTYLNSEFSRFRLEYTDRDANFPIAGGKSSEDLVTLQWIWAMGPHGAHKY